MNLLLRDLAPITAREWQTIDGEARRALEQFITGRRLFSFTGPHGHDFLSIGSGHLGPKVPVAGIEARVVAVQPMVELRAPFSVRRDELELVELGGEPDLEVVVEAARQMAAAEDALVFDGLPAAVINGAAAASPHEKLHLGKDAETVLRAVATAVTTLREHGIGGPYGIALGSQEHRRVIESTERGGYPVLQHLHLILDGPVVWAPTINGAVVVSLRGGDFEIVSGLDLSVGYRSHDHESVHLELRETVTFRNFTPEAAVVIEQ